MAEAADAWAPPALAPLSADKDKGIAVSTGRPPACIASAALASSVLFWSASIFREIILRTCIVEEGLKGGESEEGLRMEGVFASGFYGHAIECHACSGYVLMHPSVQIPLHLPLPTHTRIQPPKHPQHTFSTFCTRMFLL